MNRIEGRHDTDFDDDSERLKEQEGQAFRLEKWLIRLGSLGILRSQFGFPWRRHFLVLISSKSGVKQLESVIQLDKSSDNRRSYQLGHHCFYPDFVNGVLSPCNLVSYEVSLDKLIKDWLNIGLNLAILFSESFEATFEEYRECDLD
ncbi:hypothetical protein QUA40_02870 [Microcoleus sp. Pol11C3]|uniref:hypothetical protein n=1 Tax=Microcoleus sp. Pol11C3 TaxID=3055390 RepID=UPI002FD46278